MEFDIFNHMEDLLPNLYVRSKHSEVELLVLLVLRKVIYLSNDDSIEDLSRTGQHCLSIVEVTEDHFSS